MLRGKTQVEDVQRRRRRGHLVCRASALGARHPVTQSHRYQLMPRDPGFNSFLEVGWLIDGPFAASPTLPQTPQIAEYRVQFAALLRGNLENPSLSRRTDDGDVAVLNYDVNAVSLTHDVAPAGDGVSFGVFIAKIAS